MFNKIVYSKKTFENQQKTLKMLILEMERPKLHYYNNVSI